MVPNTVAFWELPEEGNKPAQVVSQKIKDVLVTI